MDADGTDASGGAAPDGGTGGQAAAASTGGEGGLAGASSGGGPFVGPCSRNIVGDVSVEDQADVDALRDVCIIDGDLLMAGTPVTSLDLPELATVTGRIYLQQNYALTEVDLPSLESLATANDENAGFVAVQNDTLVSVRLPSLGSTDRRIESYENPVLTELDLTSLSSADGVTLTGAALSRLDLPAFTTGDLALSSNGELEEVSAPQWGAGGLLVEYCDALAELSFPSLATGRGLVLRGNQSLTLVGVPALESTSEWLVVVDQASLEELSFPALTTTDWVEVRTNEALVSVDFPLLETITAGWLEITANPSLEELSLPTLVLGEPAHVSENPLLTICDGAALADVPDCQ